MSPTSFQTAPSRDILFLYLISQVKPMIGLEPITCWLQISCSANWATSAYITNILYSVTPTGIEPVLPPWKGDVLTAWPRSHIYFLKELTCKSFLQVAFTPRVGLEPTTLRLTAECSTIELSRIIQLKISDIPSKPHTLYIYHSIFVNTTIQVKPSTD